MFLNFLLNTDIGRMLRMADRIVRMVADIHIVRKLDRTDHSLSEVLLDRLDRLPHIGHHSHHIHLVPADGKNFEKKKFTYELNIINGLISFSN